MRVVPQDYKGAEKFLSPNDIVEQRIIHVFVVMLM